MRIAIPETLQALARRLDREGVTICAVGGLVRNALLGLPGSDVDVCGSAGPEQVRAACARAGVAVREKAAGLGTLLLHDGACWIEYTAFRSESYGPGGAHRPEKVSFGASLAEDAFRRDFTVNALYADARSGEVRDPTGGIADLSRGVIRATHADADEIMGQDALRVLRMVRLAGELSFTIEEHTFAAARRSAHQLADIAVERQWQELQRILLCDAKYPGFGGGGDGDGGAAVLDCLHQLDALGAMALLFPRLMDGRGMAQRPEFHRYDVLEHAYRACAAAPPELTLRLAALLHDIGKPESYTTQGNFHAHARLGADLAAESLERLRVPARLTEDVAWLIYNHMFDLDGRTKEKTLRQRFALWGEDVTRQLIRLREADVRGSGVDEGYVCARWRQLLAQMQAEGAPFSERALAISGRDIMEATGLAPGPAVGELKRRLFLHAAVHPRDNTRTRLLIVLKGMEPAPNRTNNHKI